jgi:hypothetical protein
VNADDLNRPEGEPADENTAARLADIDRRLARLRANIVGPGVDGPADMGDAATTLNVQDETQQMIETLENEKRRLLGE